MRILKIFETRIQGKSYRVIDDREKGEHLNFHFNFNFVFCVKKNDLWPQACRMDMDK